MNKIRLIWITTCAISSNPWEAHLVYYVLVMNLPFHMRCMRKSAIRLAEKVCGGNPGSGSSRGEGMKVELDVSLLGSALDIGFLIYLEGFYWTRF